MKFSASLACSCLLLLLLPPLALAALTSTMPQLRQPLPRPMPRTSAPAAGGVPGIPNAPEVDARAYILVDYTSGQVLAQRNADARMEPASLTKLMTCYVVFHALKAGTLKLDDRSPSASTPGAPKARAPSCRSAARSRPKCSSRA